ILVTIRSFMTMLYDTVGVSRDYVDFFFFNDPATTEIYTLSLHDALPIYIEELSQLAATQPQRVATDMDVITAAALAGKIHKLFVTLGEKTRDSVRDGMSATWLERFYRGTKGKQLSSALVEAWRHRGEIIFANSLPSNGTIAAILRY